MSTVGHDRPRAQDNNYLAGKPMSHLCRTDGPSVASPVFLSALAAALLPVAVLLAAPRGADVLWRVLAAVPIAVVPAWIVAARLGRRVRAALAAACALDDGDVAGGPAREALDALTARLQTTRAALDAVVAAQRTLAASHQQGEGAGRLDLAAHRGRAGAIAAATNALANAAAARESRMAETLHRIIVDADDASLGHAPLHHVANALRDRLASDRAALAEREQAIAACERRLAAADERAASDRRTVDLQAGRVIEATRAIDCAAVSLATSMGALAAEVGTRTGAIDDPANAIRSLGGSVRETAAHARSASELATAAHTAARDSADGMFRMMTRMETMTASARRIEDITTVIDGIAFQTNILALNAAVESARAGESGRGFAVVASEVRALAHRSTTAAREIKSLIQASVDEIALGAEHANEVGGRVLGVAESIARVSELITQIAAASHRDAAAIDRTLGGVGAHDEIARRTLERVEATRAIAEALSRNAVALGALSRELSHAPSPSSASARTVDAQATDRFRGHRARS